MPTTCPNFSVPVGIPIFGLGFISSNRLIVGGGGGAGRNGVKNRLISYKVEVRRKDLEEEGVFEVPENEDAPMCLDVQLKDGAVIAGINKSEEAIKGSKNNSCRVFVVKEAAINEEEAVRTVESTSPDDYQKVVRFSHDGTLVATGTTDGQVHLFQYNSYNLKQSMTTNLKDEVLDVDINLENDKLTCVLRDGLKLVMLRGKNAGQVIQTLTASAVSKDLGLQFRYFRYGRGVSKEVGLAVANSKKSAGYICVLDAYTLETIKLVKVSKKPITTFCVSNDGYVLAFGSADYSITLMDISTMKVLTQVKNAHGFSITSIAISPDRRLLASGSADNTCRIVALPAQFSASSINPLYTLLLAFLIAGVVLWLTTIYHGGPAPQGLLGFKPPSATVSTATPQPSASNILTSYEPVTTSTHKIEL
ncbi:hypothetical protein DFQ28_006950 [Apophysomyces sp. BC1034]|nr:hypothetical protein DFQ28_006950 [Apophysomyces sp. BC1034]